MDTKKILYDVVDETYKKISDKVMQFTMNGALYFSVDLYSLEKDKYTKEYRRRYYTQNVWYRDKENEISINLNRRFTPYLEIRPLNNNKNKLIIGLNSYYKFMLALNVIEEWLTGEKFKALYIKDKEDQIVRTNSNIRDSVYVEGEFGYTAEITPLVMNANTYINKQTPGIGIYINDESEPIFLSLDNAMNFIYFMKTFNMYQAGATLVASLGKPNPHRNNMVMDSLK